ncbi:MAG: hypothetical protein EOP56_07570 [Sphingobacteriales bacterium]|nr:MAG: hypothetical protein EOP56_07570 [Sphingobacteriales bacterium]
MKQQKSLVAAILLSVLLGPIGVFYASIWSGTILTFGPFILVFLLKAPQYASLGDAIESTLLTVFTIGILSFVIYWPFCIMWSALMTVIYNRRVNKSNYRLARTLTTVEPVKVQRNTIRKAEPQKQSNAEVRPKIGDWLRDNPGKTMQDYHSNFK